MTALTPSEHRELIELLKMLTAINKKVFGLFQKIAKEGDIHQQIR